MVTVSDVREFLADLPADYISDATINKQISIASAIIDGEKSDDADSTLVDQAKLVNAAYLTLLSYASRIERVTGVIPAPLEKYLIRFERLADRFIEYVRRSDKAPRLNVMQLTKSLLEEERNCL